MSDGATVNPHAVADSCPQLPSKGVAKTGRHHFIWLDGVRVQCSHCGEIRENTLASNRVIQPGVIHNVDPVQPSE